MIIPVTISSALTAPSLAKTRRILIVWRGLRSSSSWMRTLCVFLILVISEMGLDCSRLVSVMEGRLPAYLNIGKEVKVMLRKKKEDENGASQTSLIPHSPVSRPASKEGEAGDCN